MGGVLLSAETVETALNLVARLAAQTVPASVGAGVTIADQRGRRTTAATDAVVEQADALQYRFDAGPCLTAWRDHELVRIDDVVTESRWPQWCGSVRELGVLSVLSAPMLAGQDAIGAIKVYSDEVGAFDARSAALLALFADQAAILLANTQTVTQTRELAEQMTLALENRDVIGQAKGILLAQGAGSADAAFRMLVAVSRRTNRRVAEVAKRLVASVDAQRQLENDAAEE
ncbi:GAF and ANTAR domain-containing protein [Microlunatus soli]|nr:GAF and ANTAR domain-containing protein [Microlunatus soli]